MPEQADRPRDPVFVLGLVGRAGSGKSTVAEALARDGAAIIEADRLGHEVTDADPEVRAALIRSYGTEAYGADGALDRARVAARVFSDPEALAELNALVHPKLVERIRGRLDAYRRAGQPPVVVLDAALMLDWQLDRECDAVVAIVATDDSQVARLRSSRGWSAPQARARLDAQRSNEAFEAAADAVIRNAGTRESLESAARGTLTRLRSAGKRRSKTRNSSVRERPC